MYILYFNNNSLIQYVIPVNKLLLKYNIYLLLILVNLTFI